jgi:hypothetical protein
MSDEHDFQHPGLLAPPWIQGWEEHADVKAKFLQTLRDIGMSTDATELDVMTRELMKFGVCSLECMQDLSELEVWLSMPTQDSRYCGSCAELKPLISLDLFETLYAAVCSLPPT